MHLAVFLWRGFRCVGRPGLDEVHWVPAPAASHVRPRKQSMDEVGDEGVARAGLWGISVDILSLAWGGLERGGISVTATSFDSFFATTTASLKAVIVDSKSNDSIG